MKIAEAVTLYISLRDKKAQIVEAHKAAIKPLDTKMDKLEALLLKAMQDNSLQSVNSPDGTAYIANRSSVTTADKEVFMGYVKEHQAWDLLEVRPSKSHPTWGIVILEHRARNQRNETVMRCKRAAMMLRKPNK